MTSHTANEQLPQGLSGLPRFYAGYGWKLALLAAIAVVGALMEAASLASVPPLIEAIATPGDHVFRRNTAWLGEIAFSAEQMFLICGGAVLARTLIQIIFAYCDMRVGSSYSAQRRRRMVAAFLRADWPTQSQEHVGKLQLLLTENISLGISGLKALTHILAATCNFIVLLVASWLIDPAATLVLGGVATALFFLLRPLSTFARNHSRVKQQHHATFASAVNELVALARELRIFGGERRYQDKLNKSIRNIRLARSASLFTNSMVPVLYQNSAALVFVGSLAMVYFFGDPTRLGVHIAAALLLIRSLTHTQSLQASYHHVAEALPYLEQMEAVEATYRSAALSTGGEPAPPLQRLAFENVDFCYRPNEPVLQDVNFEIARGEAVGVVGPSGSGKSTLIQILLRLRKPTRGRMTVNGRPAEEFAYDGWFPHTALVPQEPLLLDDTVRENIRFFREISDEQIEQAAKLAGIHDEIAAMPRGYDTPAGERGSQLSGGQKQRVCIARALAGNPDLIVFDESTSALDVRSEARIRDSLDQLRGRVTLVIIAHRLTTISICDKVMVLDGGEMRAFGPPDVLAETDTFYHEALRLSQIH